MRRVHEGDVGQCCGNDAPQEGEVGAAEDQGVCTAVGEGGQVATGDGVGHLVIGPADLCQGDEERAGDLCNRCTRRAGRDGTRVGLASNRALGGEHCKAAGPAGLQSDSDTGVHDAHYRDPQRCGEALQRRESMGGGRVAGDDEGLDSLLEQERCELNGVPLHGLRRAGAVGHARRVAEVQGRLIGQAVVDGLEDGETADSRVEDPDGLVVERQGEKGSVETSPANRPGESRPALEAVGASLRPRGGASDYRDPTTGVLVRIAVYGGSFNPPHVAHAMVASWACWTGAVDAVWLVPVYQHAFADRQQKVLAPFEERCRWCEALATDVGPWVSVCRIEAELPTPSYTIDTLRALAARHPEHRFRLVVGADVLPETADWKDWTAIEDNFEPLVVGRTGYPSPGPETVDFPGVSSTVLRSRLSRGQRIDHLVTRSVAALLAGRTDLS